MSHSKAEQYDLTGLALKCDSLIVGATEFSEEDMSDLADLAADLVATPAEVNAAGAYVADLTATAAEVNAAGALVADITATAAEINAAGTLVAAITSSAAELNITDGVTATAAEINMAADSSANSEVVTTTNVIDAAESGSTYFLNSGTEFVSTLPAPALGLRYTFIVKAAPSGADYTIVTTSGDDLFLGHILTSQDAGGTADSETTGGDTISFVSAKAVVGDRVDVISDGTKWYVRGSSKVFDAITITTVA